MSLDFFQKRCQESPRIDSEFGLCDDQNGQKAYSDLTDKNKWIATIKNSDQQSVTFTAIDKCVILDGEFKGRGRCDGMLTAPNLLYLVELKDQEPPWQTHAKEQLESTIQFLIANHDISRFKKRKAYACNRKRDKFFVFDNEENISFFRRTTFRLDIQGEIVII